MLNRFLQIVLLIFLSNITLGQNEDLKNSPLISKKDTLNIILGEEYPAPVLRYKNILSYNIFDMAFSDMVIYYERILGDGHLGLKGHMGFNYNDNSEFHSFKKHYFGGVTFNYYPVTHQRWRYFAGITLRIGKANFSRYFASNYTFSSNTEYFSHNYPYVKVFFDNGILLSSSNHFYCSLVLSIGIQHKHFYYLDQFEPTAMPWLFVGYRF